MDNRLASLFGEAAGRRRARRHAVLWFVVGLAMLAALGLYVWHVRQTASAAPRFVTETLARAGIGVLFGYFPAHRAAKLDPIEALRHE